MFLIMPVGKPSDSGNKINLRYAGLMSLVDGAFENSEREDEHINSGLQKQTIKETYEVEVELKSLSEIIDESGFETIDFMSVDVEGFEYEVLQGLDLSRHRPNYLLVEVWKQNEHHILNYLEDYYNVEKRLNEKDILFGLKER